MAVDLPIREHGASAHLFLDSALAGRPFAERPPDQLREPLQRLPRSQHMATHCALDNLSKISWTSTGSLLENRPAIELREAAGLGHRRGAKAQVAQQRFGVGLASEDPLSEVRQGLSWSKVFCLNYCNFTCFSILLIYNGIAKLTGPIFRMPQTTPCTKRKRRRTICSLEIGLRAPLPREAAPYRTRRGVAAPPTPHSKDFFSF